MNAQTLQTISPALLSGVRRQPSVAGPGGAHTAAAAAKEFEQVFISQMLGQMFSGLTTDGPFGGGAGEEAFRGFLTDEYARQISASGGFGLAEDVQRELLSLQEIK
ncbi:MAG: rod-binding protein [Flavobacteriaceae bacterium]